MSPQLTRSETDRAIAGVAGGIAERFGINSTLVRLAWVLSVFFGGVGIARDHNQGKVTTHRDTSVLILRLTR